MPRESLEQEEQDNQGMPNIQATEYQGNQLEGMTTNTAQFIFQMEVKSKTSRKMTTELLQPIVQRQFGPEQITNTNSPNTGFQFPTNQVGEWDSETFDIMVDHLMSVFHTAMDPSISAEDLERRKTPEYLRCVERKKNLLNSVKSVRDNWKEILKHLDNPIECQLQPTKHLQKLLKQIEPSAESSESEAQAARPSTLIAVLTKVVSKMTAEITFHSNIEEPLPSFLPYIKRSFESAEKLQSSVRCFLKVADPSTYNPSFTYGTQIWYYPQGGSVDKSMTNLRNSIGVYRTEIVETLHLPLSYQKFKK
ncbi:hypothetical protein BZA77DRAFT_321752 [Pyronema omphalodes]|nr:hypothetical protein BZA77DRAFT_321752 [Pyronema omphalodes]